MHLKPEPFNTECNQYSLLPTTCTNIQHLSIEHPPTHTHTHTHTHTLIIIIIQLHPLGNEYQDSIF